MEKLTLTDLIPQQSTFTLSATGDKIHRLRPMNLEDHAWVLHTFGSQEEVQKVFTEMDWGQLSRLVYRLLIDKTPFASIQEETLDENGDAEVVKVGGSRLLFQSIRSLKEQIEVQTALLRTIGISQPIQEKLEAEDAKEATAQKKRAHTNPIGKKSSTASKANTDTRSAR